MTLILISDPEKTDGEHELVNSFFESGLDYFHLRKPGYSKTEMETFIRQLNPKYIKKTLLHSHHDLVEKYNIGGFHFPAHYLKNEEQETIKALVKEAKKRRLRTGTSVHSLLKAKEVKGFDYFFLSPVFDSISKDGYKASFDFDELSDYLMEGDPVTAKPERIALGGVDASNIRILKNMGFSGAALMGAIWKNYRTENFKNVVQGFREIQTQVKND